MRKILAKTIAISINSSWNIINFRHGLIRALQESGYDVIAIAPLDAHSFLLTDLRVRHVPVEIDNRGTSPRRDLELIRDYVRILRSERPSAYLGFTIKPNIYGSIVARILGVPVINNIAGLGDTFTSTGWINRLVRQLYRFSLSTARVVFFQNPDDMRLFISAGLVQHSISRLLPGSGVDLEQFQPANAVRTDSGTFTFLLVTRLLWAKGIADFVEAARLMKQQNPLVRFQLLGLRQHGRDAIDEQTIAGWVKEGVIEFLGSTGDVRPMIAASQCIVLPSAYPEGTPRALLEAAAMAKPLIATDIPGCREIVRHGLNGFLVAPHAPQDLATQMIKMINLPHAELARMGAASRQIAETDFDEKIVIDRYLKALNEIVR